MALVDLPSSCCSLGQTGKQTSSSQCLLLCMHCQCCSPSACACNFSSPSLIVTVRKIARIVALEFALGLKHLLQCTSLSLSLSLSVCVCVYSSHVGSTCVLFLPLPQKPLLLEAAPRSLPPQSAYLECCSAYSGCCSACCSPTRPKTVWTPFKNFVSAILKLVEFVLPNPIVMLSRRTSRFI